MRPERGALHLERLALDDETVRAIALKCPGMDNLAALLPNRAERQKLADWSETDLFLELAAGRVQQDGCHAGPGIFVRPRQSVGDHVRVAVDLGLLQRLHRGRGDLEADAAPLVPPDELSLLRRAGVGGAAAGLWQRLPLGFRGF